MSTPSRRDTEPGRKKILLLDDDRTLRHLRTNILALHGFEVDSTSSVEEARTRWQPKRYDLVVVDVKHGGVDYLNFCQELKNNDPDQLFAVLTGTPVYVPDGTCADDVISRDHGPKHLVERIKFLLYDSSAPSESN